MIKRMVQMQRSFKALTENIPYKIKSIQVDGGSEFMKEFKGECEATGSSGRNSL